MNITMIGTGYVGLVSGACFAEFGFNVICVDKDQAKIDQLKQNVMPIYETGLEDLVARNAAAGRLAFTTDIGPAVRNADVVFIAVGTPEGRDRRPNLSYARAAAAEIAPHLTGYTVVVNKSTVPVGFGREVQEIITELNPGADFDICSCPEFLREGSAIEDLMKPDRIVIGTDSERAAELMKAVYRPLYINETPFVMTSLETAELIKYASNAFLATKITFINEIANLCEKVGANVQEVARGMGLDNRIGKKFLHAGPGYGGSCFPKDTNALAELGNDRGAPQNIVQTVIRINAERKNEMAQRVIDALGGAVTGRKIGILGLTFKPHTDDMRDSVSLSLIPALQAAGASIRAHDPAGMGEAVHFLSDVDYATDAYDVARGADALVILTEWREFRGLDLHKIKGLMEQPIFLDFRNVYQPQTVRDAGFIYYSIGRP